nr:hypothetical protein [uncultured Neokomagataea sp.]
MNEVMIYVLLGFVVLASGMLIWITRLAMRAQAEHEALVQKLEAQNVQREQAALDQTQAMTAPTQTALNTILQDGTF